jgi:hypothetical protein
MVPISDLIAQHQKLASKLARFSFPKAAQLVGALGIVPELLENTIRIEILAHLVSSCCRGHTEPKPSDLATWIGKLMDDSPAARMEDPAEDLFVGCVNSEFGSFRILQGNFGDGAFLVERLVAFYAEKLNFPTFQDTIDRVLALLRLSDALAERAGLPRYCAGGGNAAARIRIPKWRDLEPKFRSVVFSNEDLQSLGIGKPLLRDFFMDEEHRVKLLQETMWSSSLERRPLLEHGNGVLVVEPSTFCRTAVRFMIERMRIIGGWGETFYQKDNATTFVNEVRSQMKVEWLDDFSGPNAEEGTPFMFPAVGAFDHGKPVIMLTYTPPLANAVEDFAGFDEFSAEEQSKFERYIQACAAALEKLPGFSGGMVLICYAGYGRGGTIGLSEWSPKWRVHVATLRDWLSLTANGECTAMRLWKLGEHEIRRRSLGVELLNPAGLPNLVAFWKQSGFRLVPREMDIHQQRKMAVIECNFAQSIRVAGTQQQDEHCIRSHDGKNWIRLIRHNARSLFPEDSDAPIYGAIAEARRRLIGCTKRGAGIWWIISPESPDRADLRDLLYQLWDCALNWMDHLVLVAEREWPAIREQGVEIRLELPDFARWEHGQPGAAQLSPAELSVEISQSESAMTVTVPEGFLRYFNIPKNVAERKIVAALLEGASRLGGAHPTPERIKSLTQEVVRNDDARYFHVVETREIEQLLGSERRPRPLFVADEDSMLVQLGLADLAGRPNENLITGKEKCQKFLQDTVTKIWERIEARLRAFDRASVVSGCFRALDEIARDEAHWNLTTRSIFALHDDQGEAKGVLRHRRSERSAANMGNRLLIETAQYACRSEGGLPFTMADHSSLLAEQTLLTEFAHHRDAIAYGFLKPEVKIYPNGEIEVDTEFYKQIFTRYLSHRSDIASERAADSYDKHFESPEPPSDQESTSIDKRIADLNEAFKPEFGFSIEKLIEVMDMWRKFAIKANASGGQLTEEEMLGLLRHGCGFSASESNAFLARLTLPIRSQWDTELPPRCKKEDVYPWRFRRHLSLLFRPLVEVSKSPRTWIISAPFFEKSASYLMENIEKADFPERFFESERMRKYIGQKVNRRGHAFATKVHNAFIERKFLARLEIEMTELGASKNDGLGDIDVLAWNAETGVVFPVECKRLLPALTVREVIQRLEDFRGDKKAKDSLGRHLRRIDWLSQNLTPLENLTGIPKDRIRLLPCLVTSDIVPMQFFQEMNFPPEQVVPFDGLAAFIAESE